MITVRLERNMYALTLPSTPQTKLVIQTQPYTHFWRRKKYHPWIPASSLKHSLMFEDSYTSQRATNAHPTTINTCASELSRSPCQAPNSEQYLKKQNIRKIGNTTHNARERAPTLYMPKDVRAQNIPNTIHEPHRTSPAFGRCSKALSKSSGLLVYIILKMFSLLLPRDYGPSRLTKIANSKVTAVESQGWPRQTKIVFF